MKTKKSYSGSNHKLLKNSLEDSMVPYLNNDLLLIDFQLVSPIF